MDAGVLLSDAWFDSLLYKFHDSFNKISWNIFVFLLNAFILPRRLICQFNLNIRSTLVLYTVHSIFGRGLPRCNCGSFVLFIAVEIEYIRFMLQFSTYPEVTIVHLIAVETEYIQFCLLVYVTTENDVM